MAVPRATPSALETEGVPCVQLYGGGAAAWLENNRPRSTWAGPGPQRQGPGGGLGGLRLSTIALSLLNKEDL